MVIQAEGHSAKNSQPFFKNVQVTREKDAECVAGRDCKGDQTTRCNGRARNGSRDRARTSAGRQLTVQYQRSLAGTDLRHSCLMTRTQPANRIAGPFGH